MTELAVAKEPKQQEEIPTPLRLEALGKGIGDINTKYPLHEVITFIEGFNVYTSVRTSQPDCALEIAFPTPSLFSIKRLKKFDSIIYITGPLKKQKPELKARGKRQIWRPTNFVALILLSNEKVEKIILSTKLSKKNLELMARNNMGEIPNNWHFKPNAI